MDSAALTLAVDATLIILLVVMIISAYRLHQRLNIMRSGQDELRKTVDNLNQAIGDAQRSVAGLKLSATDIQETLGIETRAARALADELKLITEAGNNLADRIERGLVKSRPDETNGGSGSSSAAPGTISPTETDQMRAQQALLKALKDAR